MKFKDYIKQLEEGYDNRGVQDGTGPYKKSAMAQQGRIGPKAGRKLGKCPIREDYDNKEEFEKALEKWKTEKSKYKSQ